jgi:tetratricopeptide (TPR) repeat protein
MTTLETVVSAEHWLDQAIAASAAGELAEARICLQNALETDPQNGELILVAGHVKLGMNDLTGALDNYTLAARLLPYQANAHSSRALALQLLQRTVEARMEAHQALNLDGDDMVAMKVLARIFLDAQQLAEAQAHCRQILALNPQDSEAKSMLLQSGPTQSPVQLTPRATTVAVPATPPAISPHAAPSTSEKIRKLEGLLGDYAARCEAWENLGVEHLTQQLVVGDFKKTIAIATGPVASPVGADGLPVPPAELTMGYGAGNLDHYLACGRKSYESLTRILQLQQVELNPGDAMLDWGGAAGRVVRNFSAEAQRGCEVWGCDVHASSIQWAQNHLSPPFKFFNSSALPHLPFADGHFKFIYGLSVFTHLIALRDLWLLELRRVLRPDGCLILTVHNESTWDWFRNHQAPPWMPQQFREVPEMPGGCVEIRGSRWEHCYTFFRSDYLRRVWGQFFHVADIVPCAEGYQTAVVMKKF